MDRRRLLISSLYLTLACGGAWASGPAEATPSAGTLLSINADAYDTLKDLDRVVLPDFAMPGGPVALTLTQFDILAPDAVIVGATDAGDLMIPRPEVALFRGQIEGHEGSQVFLSITPEAVNGFIRTPGETFLISSGRAGRGLPAVIYSLTHLPEGAIQWAAFECAADELLRETQAPVGGSQAPRGGSCRVAKVAVETDWQFRQLFGSQSGASAYAMTLLGAVNEIYQRDVDTTLTISFLRIWNTSNDPWNETNTTNQLFQYRDYWEDNEDGVDRHLGHFLSGRGLGGGVAWLPGLCYDNYHYGLSANLDGFFPYPIEDNRPDNWDLMVVSHEIGHNCGAPHTHNLSPPVDNCAGGDCSVTPNGTIMSYCHLCPGGLANVLMEFHPRNINERMLPFLNDPNTVTRCGDLTGGGVTITDHPDSDTVCPGDSTTFSVSATGSGLGYQWRRNGSNIGGATASSYTINNIDSGHAGSYDVVVTGDCGSATSNAATLTVQSDVSITADPAGAAVCEGAPASFSVSATGSGLSYQWRKDGGDIPGANSDSYDIAAAAPADAGSYDVVVTGDCGSQTSAAADLVVCGGASGDLDGDCAVDLTDLSLLLANFGSSGVGPEQGDLDGDTDVDLTDLSLQLASFGTVCA